MKPLLKWAGGKRLLVKEIVPLINVNLLRKHNGRLFEPFCGGASVSFLLELPNTSLNDKNSELINTYVVVRDYPEELISILKKYQKNFSKTFYLEIRNKDRNPKFKDLSPVERAARFIFLNKTCYNGLYRVNSNGFFNVPIGKYVKPNIVNEESIRKISKLFKEKEFCFTNLDFEESVEAAGKGDVVYFDPPYDYDTTGFTSYSQDGFDRDELVRLKKTCDRLINRGVRTIVSNNDTEFVRNLFSNDAKYKIFEIKANRFIGRDGESRKKVQEVLIYGGSE